MSAASVVLNPLPKQVRPQSISLQPSNISLVYKWTHLLTMNFDYFSNETFNALKDISHSSIYFYLITLKLDTGELPILRIYF